MVNYADVNLVFELDIPLRNAQVQSVHVVLNGVIRAICMIVSTMGLPSALNA